MAASSSSSSSGRFVTLDEEWLGEMKEYDAIVLNKAKASRCGRQRAAREGVIRV
jgi:hypothetical protein